MKALKTAAVLAAAAGLVTACSSLSVPTAAKLGALDYLNDDIASLVLAFDVPETLEPVPDASGFSFAVSIPGKGERKVTAVLAPGDASEVAGTLPPPGNERTYYLFGFSDADKARLREAQAWARGIAETGVAPNRPVISIAPRFCRSDTIDAAKTKVSVLVALPGQGALEPLISNESLSAVLASSGGGTLPACAGHSG
jgi:hypothetical protein